jgi:DNA-3-methyladenine glycosylase
MNDFESDLNLMRSLLRQDVVAASEALLGWHLVCGNQICEVVETEAYDANDPGCHAFGKTKMKNMAMFGQPGMAYVYFTYGNHWMLCISAHEHGDPAAVLIRAARPISGFGESANLAGPGRLTKATGICSDHNAVDLLDPSSALHFRPGSKIEEVGVSKRIGLAIGKGEETLWRFFSVKHLQWCTKHKFNRQSTIKRSITH